MNESGKLDNDLKYYPFNPPNPCVLEVSPDGKYFLVKLFAGPSFLYDSISGKHVDFALKKIDSFVHETIIGFSKSGHIYCGVQSVNPMLLLRNIETGEILKSFEHPSAVSRLKL
ncbi:MAG: hypothetical protein FWH27_08100 [Planctomycetaceae bacterium]|nr:hypothetical protein [Planctomycetaceae bacterium]